jgi:hypothetical protein
MSDRISWAGHYLRAKEGRKREYRYHGLLVDSVSQKTDWKCRHHHEQPGEAEECARREDLRRAGASSAEIESLIRKGGVTDRR